ncbi:MAG: hypothetical protein ABSB35_16045, partial [Bryobacteraceae bacterium]
PLIHAECRRIGLNAKFLPGRDRHAVPLLLRNSRKTECGAKQFLTRLVVRAAPFALLRDRGL